MLETGAMRLLAAVTLCVSANAVDPVLNSSFLMPSDFTSYHLVTWSVDYGHVPDEPLMHPKFEWDEEIGGKGTVMVDPVDGKYKAWYISQPGIDYLTMNSTEGKARMISYAYSEDGVNWERPLLDVVKWNGSNSNILLHLAGDHECDYACVFVDPHAANQSRTYEMLALLSAAPPGFPVHNKHVIYRYYSPDGIHWEPYNVISRGPCHGGTWCSDSLYINKLKDGTYQAILKHGPSSGAPPGGVVPFDIAAGGARWIYVSNSTDGNTWEPATLALSPDWRDPVGFQVISSISTIQAKASGNGGAGVLVGWLPVFHSLSQTIDMQLCASNDQGQTWWRPERRSAVQFKEMGYYGGGMMWPYRLFVPDRDDPTKVHAYFSGCQGRHADIHSTLPGERFASMRSEWESNGAWGYKNLQLGMEKYSPIRSTNWFRGALMRATWDSSRLWALVPAAGGDIAGQAITRPFELSSVGGMGLEVNLKVHNQTRTKQYGNILVELQDSEGHAIPGYSEADCFPVGGDAGGGSSYHAKVTWKAGQTLPKTGATSIRMRFVLLRARLYSFDFVNAATG